MTKITFVRHGETDWNRAKKIQGSVDVPLNETGRKQAQETAKSLRGKKFDAIYSSPLARARETAEIIAGGDVQIDERLKERCFGPLEGLDWENLPKEEPWDVPGGESINELTARVVDFIDEVAITHKGGNVLVVAHAIVGLVFHVHFHGAPADGNFFKITVPNANAVEYVKEGK